VTRSAVLLAGGRSRRLGRDKPLVEIGGRTILERTLEATAAVEDIVLSVRDAAPHLAVLVRAGWRLSGPETGDDRAFRELLRGTRRLRVVPDPTPDLGPVAGLAAGLAAARGDRAVVLAADLPFVTASLVERLFDALDRTPACDAVVPSIDGREQPLLAAYRTRVTAAAASRLAAVPDAGGRSGSARGGPSVAGLLHALRVVRIDGAALGPIEEVRRAARGIDTPLDLEWARGVGD
jgi:molybdopterin-guanine dinucleotide biosynthesis protein A